MSSQSPQDCSELETPDSTTPSSLIFADFVDETIGEVDGNDFRAHTIRMDSHDRVESKGREATNKNCPLFCMVCAGPATGHHYDVASCNGCKAFFRRSYISGKRYKCRMSSNCNITEGKRTLCRACRYNKCVEVGMRPELMQFTDDVTSSQSTHAAAPKNPRWAETFAMQSATSNSLRFDESEFGAIIGALVYKEAKCDFLRQSTFDPTCTAFSLIDLISAPSELGNLHTYQLVRDWPKKHPPLLDYHRQQRLDDLPTSKLWIICDFVLNVEFAKTLTFFQRLLFNDKKTEKDVRSAKSLKNHYGLAASEGMSTEGRTLLDKEREKMAKVLFNYTNARHGATVGSCRFATLVALVGTFFHLAPNITQ